MPFYGPMSLGGYTPSQGTDLIRRLFPGASDLTSYPGQGGAGTAALGFSHGGPPLFAGQPPSSLDTLQSSQPNIIPGAGGQPDSITAAISGGTNLPGGVIQNLGGDAPGGPGASPGGSAPGGGAGPSGPGISMGMPGLGPTATTTQGPPGGSNVTTFSQSPLGQALDTAAQINAQSLTGRALDAMNVPALPALAVQTALRSGLGPFAGLADVTLGLAMGKQSVTPTSPTVQGLNQVTNRLESFLNAPFRGGGNDPNAPTGPVGPVGPSGQLGLQTDPTDEGPPGITTGPVGGLPDTGPPGAPTADPDTAEGVTGPVGGVPDAGPTGEGGSCFPAGTRVDTEHGPRAIEDIRVGDRIWSRNWTTKQDELAVVCETFAYPARPLFRVNGLRVTGRHRFAIGDDAWVRVEDMIPTEMLTTRVGFTPLVAYGWDHADTAPVFNLAVEWNENFYVVDDGLVSYLVHNGGGAK